MGKIDKISLIKKLFIFLAVLVMFLFAYNSYSLENFDLTKIDRSNVAWLSEGNFLNA